MFPACYRIYAGRSKGGTGVQNYRTQGIAGQWHRHQLRRGNTAHPLTVTFSVPLLSGLFRYPHTIKAIRKSS